MSRIRTFLFTAIALLTFACATAPPPAPVAQGEDRFLIDPRTGYTAPAPSEKVAAKFENAWRYVLTGDSATAQKLLSEIRAKNPEYAPAALAEAALDIRAGNFDAAKKLVDNAQSRVRDYTAAEVYAAEIAYRQQQLRAAYYLYGAAAARPNVPAVVAERFAAVRQAWFSDLFQRGRSAKGPEASQLLYEALVIDPGAIDVRVLLAQRLVEQRNWGEARRILEPVARGVEAERTDVQELLAEIDAGRGQYEDAIARYERLARRDKDPRFARRLEEIKEQWNAENMPPQYRRALESEVLTRADLAVLLYWRVAQVRFAQNLGTPPIAIDISEVPGREEIVRAIAIGVLQVDPVTRRVGPQTPVKVAALARYAARVLVVRGAQCARLPRGSATDAAYADQVLAACGVPNPALTLPADAPVSGKEALAVVDQIEKVLSR